MFTSSGVTKKTNCSNNSNNTGFIKPIIFILLITIIIWLGITTIINM